MGQTTSMPTMMTMDVVRSRPIRRRRTHSSLPRYRQVVVRFSEVELSLVRGCADRAGLALGAWVGEMAVRAADKPDAVVPPAWRDVVATLVQIRAALASPAELPHGREHGERLLRHLDELTAVAIEHLPKPRP
jgi:hypothetical protein